MTRLNKINSESQYQSVMKEIEHLMFKGSTNLTEGELLAIRVLSEAAQDYEQAETNIDLPSNISELLLVCMEELEMDTIQFAAFLQLNESLLNDLLSGKAKADIDLLKKLHDKLKLDAAFLLQAA